MTLFRCLKDGKEGLIRVALSNIFKVGKKKLDIKGKLKDRKSKRKARNEY